MESPEHTDAITGPQILNPVNYSPALRKTKCFQKFLRIAKQLFDDDAFCFFDLVILKKPTIGVATPWHQDEAFRDPRLEHNELSIWVPCRYSLLPLDQFFGTAHRPQYDRGVALGSGPLPSQDMAQLAAGIPISAVDRSEANGSQRSNPVYLEVQAWRVKVSEAQCLQ